MGIRGSILDKVPSLFKEITYYLVIAKFTNNIEANSFNASSRGMTGNEALKKVKRRRLITKTEIFHMPLLRSAMKQ